MRRIGGITLEQLCARRPYLYHLTARRNLSFIQETRKLLPAAALLTRSGRADMLRIRRCQHTEIFIDEFPVMIRDQAPLISGNVVFSEGYSITDFIESLNNRVFFWPGRESGPISYGVRHFKRYRYENPAMLKIDTRACKRER